MDFIKRNLVLVVVIIVALGLLGFGGYSLYAKYQQDAEITGTLQSEIEAYKALTEKDPHPDDENLKSAKGEQKRITEYLQNSRRAFAAVPVPSAVDNATFRNLLDNTVSELRRDAERYGVSLANLPPKYGFTFAAQLQLVQYAPNTLDPLATQLAEIKALVNVLYHANVHALLGLRRVSVSTNDDTFGSPDYLIGKKIGTDADTGGVLTPYEVTFQGFSTELASVLEGLYRSPYCFVVRNVTVDKAATAPVEGDASATPTGIDPAMAARYGMAAPQAAPVQGMDPGLAARYGLGAGGPAARYGGKMDGPGGGMDAAMRRRYGLAPGGRSPMTQPQPGVTPMAPPPGVAPPPGTPGAPTGPTTRQGITTILDESPLRVVLLVDSIRFPETPVAAAPAGGKPTKEAPKEAPKEANPAN